MVHKAYQGGDYLAEGGRVLGRHTVDDAPLRLAVTRANRTLYDPEHVLMPDTITDACGRLTAFCIDDYPVLGYAEPSAVRVVDMGTGSGVFAVSMLDGLKIPTAASFSVHIVDLDQKALDTARVNVGACVDASPRPIDVSYVNEDYLEGLSGYYDYIYFNPPFLERGHDITHADAALAPDQALFVDQSTQEYARVVPHLASFLTEKGIALIRLPRKDPKVDQWVVEFMREHSNARLLLVDDKQGRKGRLLAVVKSLFPNALGSYDYWENYLGGDERRARAKSDEIPVYHDDNCEITLVRKGPDVELLGDMALRSVS